MQFSVYSLMPCTDKTQTYTDLQSGTFTGSGAGLPTPANLLDLVRLFVRPKEDPGIVMLNLKHGQQHHPKRGLKQAPHLRARELRSFYL